MPKIIPYEYTRILEILDDYWISCIGDEVEVEVQMHFRKNDGQEQCKTIIWRNAKEGA